MNFSLLTNLNCFVLDASPDILYNNYINLVCLFLKKRALLYTIKFRINKIIVPCNHIDRLIHNLLSVSFLPFYLISDLSVSV